MSSIGMGQRKLAFSATVCSTEWPDKSGRVLLECGQTFRGVMVGVDSVCGRRGRLSGGMTSYATDHCEVKKAPVRSREELPLLWAHRLCRVCLLVYEG